ncbi:MAG: TolC family protein [Planctomycetia bacterium]|nr:TolC family protein [Planctomycetia bacterium]
MKSILPAWLTLIAPLAALIGAAGCASTTGDLAAMKNSAAKHEAAPLPASIVKSPREPRGSTVIVLAGGEQPDSEQVPKRSAAGTEADSGEKSLEKRIQVPRDLPGAEVPRLNLPLRTGNEQAYETAIRTLFPSLSDAPPMNVDEAAAATRKMTLFELEQTALANSPLIAQARADVTSAVGSAIQAGTAPNPTIGYEADTVGSAGTRNYQGVFATQLIKTAGKLQVAQAIENVDLMNAQLALRQARFDLLTQVRRQYFALLVAREAIRINEAIVKFTHELYRIHVDQVSQEVAAPYEPMQLRTFAVMARGELVKARNNYVIAWKQLTATLNSPEMPLADLVDSPGIPVPQLDYDSAVAHVLSVHTEAQTSRNMPIRASLDLRLAEITPIPDISIYGAIQRDFTTPGLGRTSYNTQVGMPFPIFDRNKGNILSAKGALLRATQEVTRVENDLRSRLADAFGRFETNRYLVDTQRKQILPDSVRTYRGTYEQHIQAPKDVGFADVIVAQQNLLNSVSAYLGSLSGQWNAFVDIANLLQVENLQELQLKLQEQDAPPAPEPLQGKTDKQDDMSAMLEELLSDGEKR